MHAGEGEGMFLEVGNDLHHDTPNVVGEKEIKRHTCFPPRCPSVILEACKLEMCRECTLSPHSTVLVAFVIFYLVCGGIWCL